jgi:hypothetical protein
VDALGLAAEDLLHPRLESRQEELVVARHTLQFLRELCIPLAQQRVLLLKILSHDRHG